MMMAIINIGKSIHGSRSPLTIESEPPSQTSSRSSSIFGTGSSKMKQEASCTLYLAAVSALLGAIGMGVSLGWTAPAFDWMAQPDSEPQLTNTPEHKDAKTWIGSSMTIGALIGAMFSGTMAGNLGRKKALIIYGIPFTIGWIMLVAAKSVGVLIAGRFVLGISVGLLSGTAPSYVVEISIIDIRGLLGACFQLCVTIGILLVYVIGAFVPWKVLAGCCMIPTILMSICMFFMPETPNWLISKGHSQEAADSLRRLRGDRSDYEQELRQLQQQAEASATSEKFKLSNYCQRPHLLPFILAMLLMLFQQFSGINAVMFYATDIFTEAGSSLEPKYATIIIGVAQVLATGFGSFLMDRLGRKILLIASGTLHVVSLAALGGYYYKASQGTAGDLGWLPLVSLVVFIIGFSVGFGPVPWLMVAELTPMESRSTTSAMATAFNWTCAFLITKNFELLQQSLTQYGTFFMFSAISLISIVFAVLLLPETKGKSSEQIKEYFRSKSDRDRREDYDALNPSNKVELDRMN